MSHSIDAEFLALPLSRLADAALQQAKNAGAQYAAFRAERILDHQLRLRDSEVEGISESEDIGFAVRVLVDGTWGFAAGIEHTAESAAITADRAVQMAKVSSPVNGEPVELAAEPSHGDQTWVSDYQIDPFSITDDEKVSHLSEWSHRLLGAPGVDHVDVSLASVKENKYYADLNGTTTFQQRVRLHPSLTAISIDPTSGAFETMSTVAPPVGRGWEYLQGMGWNWDEELAQLPDWLVQKLTAPSIEPGTYDLVIDPTNLWLTIHESIGHATELDRALGYEANYAGTSFATPDKLGVLKYGSPLMNVTGDRTVAHGLSTIAFDDEGVQAQEFDLIKDGTLVGYQLDRSIAARAGYERSNGCALADSAEHVPIQRMANVSLKPHDNGPTTQEMISGVDNGLYIVGDKSWSIDMQRYNFQFTGQRFFRIRNGELVGQVKDVAYQANTTDFWGSMDVVGNASTFLLAGAFNCGKAQPGQIAAVSHGSPAAQFSQVNILNTAQEGAR